VKVPTRRRQADVLLRLVAAAGLAVDAGIHADQAPAYSAIRASISQATLFEIEAGLAAAAVVLVLAVGRRTGFGFAALVAVSALGAGLLYRFVDVGTLGPLPNMYEPVWLPGQIASVVAEAVAMSAALAGLLLGWQGRRSAGPIRGAGVPVTVEGVNPDVSR
jgi:hypothetical protein